MYINKNSTIAGIRANTIRKVLRLANPAVDAAGVATVIAWKISRAEALMAELKELGYFTEVDGQFALTEQGRVVRDANWVDIPTRAQAENLLQRAIITAELINDLPDCSHLVRRLEVGGDYAAAKDPVRKLEIVAQVEPRPAGGFHERNGVGSEDILRVFQSLGKHVKVRLEAAGVADGAIRQCVFEA